MMLLDYTAAAQLFLSVLNYDVTREHDSTGREKLHGRGVHSIFMSCGHAEQTHTPSAWRIDNVRALRLVGYSLNAMGHNCLLSDPRQLTILHLISCTHGVSVRAGVWECRGTSVRTAAWWL